MFHWWVELLLSSDGFDVVVRRCVVGHRLHDVAPGAWQCGYQLDATISLCFWREQRFRNSHPKVGLHIFCCVLELFWEPNVVFSEIFRVLYLVSFSVVLWIL